MSAGDRTRWGGVRDGTRRGAGFFRVERDGGIWWLVDPDGGRFLSKGVNTVRFDQDYIRGGDRSPYAEACRREHGGEEAWRIAVARRLRAWGFNTLGCWSDSAANDAGGACLATARLVDLGAMFITRQCERSGAPGHDAFPDVFDPEFANFVADTARRSIAPAREARDIIGWFTDNELRWGPDWRGGEELLEMFLNFPAGSSGREAALALLSRRHPNFAAFRDAWPTRARSWDEFRALGLHARPLAEERGARREAAEADCEAFAGDVAERYFAAMRAAVKAADPNHLLLGCRFALVPRRAVVAAAGRHLDVLTFNCYDDDPTRALGAYAEAARPLLVGEFSFRGEDSGLPNTVGAGPRRPTQKERARAFVEYATAALKFPQVVGYHWFEHADQPAEGRFDGENSNFGTVTIGDVPYEELTRAMTEFNARAEAIHAQAGPLVA